MIKGRACFKIILILNVLRETGCLRRKWRINYLTTRRNNQYNKTNVMHSLFNLLRIKGLYMFRALLADPQDVPHNGQLVHLAAPGL
jgi:hypothetical protein